MVVLPCPLARISAMLLGYTTLLSFIISQTLAQNGPAGWTASPFNAPALPLAVRSPYLSTWLGQGNAPQPLNNLWPNIWTIAGITGWFSLVVVDGNAYRIMGETAISNLTLANQTSVEFTATRTSFLYTAGPMQINASFISPIEPTDLVRQSLPFAYYTMSAKSLDGNAHQLRMYSDISGEFITGDTTEIATWNGDDEGSYVVLSMQLQTQQQYTELGNHAQDATEYYSFKKISGATTTWAITEDLINRNRAMNMSSLGNTQDPTPRAVSVNWPTLGIAVDWTSISQTSEPAVWSIGLIRNPSIQYRTPSGTLQDRIPYFMTQYSDGVTASKAFLDDYDRAASAAAVLDDQIRSAGGQYSNEYVNLLELSARQAMATMEITISKTGGGDWNYTDTKAFMKNMGNVGSDANGNTMSVNTVDVLYAAFPALLYFNPELGGQLLSPLLEYQDSSTYTLSYAARNIGSSYPNATADGITDTHDYRIEETANMLIMTLAYSQRSGNGTFISRHYTLLRSWADYLVNNTLTPINQKSADFTLGSQTSSNNQTNIALKGIIGISAMAKMASYAGSNGDQQRFNDTALSYISQWQANTIAPDNSHLNFIYGDSDTNGLIYNLYADKLCQLSLVSDQVYQVATVFYNNIAGQTRYGLSLDNNDATTSAAHWMMFSASTVTNLATQTFMVSQLNTYASSNQNNTPFSANFNPTTGIATIGKNSPAVGGVFALLALNTTIQSKITIPTDGSTITDGSGSSSSGKKSNAGAIAGGVIGGLAGAGLIGFGIFFFMRRRRMQVEQEKYDTRPNPIGSYSISPTSYSSGPGKLPGFNDGATFEPFRYGDSTHNVSASPLNPHGTVAYTSISPGTLPVGDAAVYASTAQNVRDSTYFRTHRPGESDDIGPSASQVGSSTTSSGRGSGRGSSRGGGSSGRGRGQGSSSDGTAPQQVMLAKQTLLNEELRSEVDNLRRDLERIREERHVGVSVVHEDAPPSYDEPA
ncbi:DUF1793-domain-containing protein [Fomitiporia mediterranea MF3/22]|uniref:DUF1793-domain-containing protein n=1 Tax=Fomitiporia mediterranea (strain MF3/22) TaxID=694068 RepID=UPI0004409C25|nr:DUF1793-domain-containing protein [Fomitiporia mediterranea MF3/22]EJC98593.1 DUF1793-domain-containing protein [Fomitiporia mediterranea MF3/22]